MFLQILKWQQSGCPAHPEKESYISNETVSKRQNVYNASRHSNEQFSLLSLNTHAQIYT